MIVLHHVPQSRSMRVLWLLHELDIPFAVRVHPFDKTLRSPEYLILSPAGRVPAVEIDGERMFESLAIMEYLCERYPEAGLGRDPRDMDRMGWLTWLHFAETVSQHVAALTQQHVLLREPWMRSATVMRLEAKRLEKCYAAIEARLSTPIENRDTLLTSGFSAADIATGQAVWLGRYFVPPHGFPELTKWLDRLMERPAFQKSLPAPGEPVIYDRTYPMPESAA